MPMMPLAVVSGTMDHPSFVSQPRVYPKSVTKPLLVALGGEGGLMLPNGWELVAL